MGRLALMGKGKKRSSGGSPPAQAGTTLDLSSGSTNAASGTLTTTMTVPADATLAIIAISTAPAAGATANFISDGAMTMTKGGTDTAMVAVQPSTRGDGAVNQSGVGMFYLALPDTGSNKTIKWDWTGTDTAGYNPYFTITFWKSVDTSSPVRGTGGGQGAQFTGPPWTTNTITAAAGDLIVAFAGGNSGFLDATINSWSNLTLLTQGTNNGAQDGAWATGSPSGNTTVAASTGTSWTEGGIVAVSLKPSP